MLVKQVFSWDGWSRCHVTDIAPMQLAGAHKVPHVLTDSELPLYPLNVAVSVLSLDGVTVAHQLHKLFGQDTVLQKDSIPVTGLYVYWFHGRNPSTIV